MLFLKIKSFEVLIGIMCVQKKKIDVALKVGILDFGSKTVL